MKRSLSVRQLEVAKLIAQGLTNKELAVALKIEIHTAETHRTNIYKKVFPGGGGNAVKLTHWAIKNGLLGVLESV